MRWLPGVPQETWVDRQVREAQEKGAFTGLTTAGRPLAEASLTQSAQEWAISWARREGADLTAALPPALALRVERERLVAELPAKAREADVTRAVDDFNARLDAAYRRPQEHPPVAVPFLDLDRQLARWREAHAASVSPTVGRVVDQAVATPAPPDAAAATAVAARGRRRWWLLWRARSGTD